MIVLRNLLNTIDQELYSYMYSPDKYQKDIYKFCQCNALSIRNVLNKNLSLEESFALLELFFLKGCGWYLYLNGMGKKLLSLAATEIGVINGIYAFNNEEEYHNYLKLTSTVSEELGKLVCSVYAKQKIATKYALSKAFGVDAELTLYRGIKTENTKYYIPNGLESYTSNFLVACRFAKTGKGIIIRRKISINHIFAYAKSVYKTECVPPLQIRELINKEKEYIVENIDNRFDLKKVDNMENVYDIVSVS